MNKTQPDNIKPANRRNIFRHDINGLRAWAVVAVVCYHFGVPGFFGGFVGVDIFFVISGFLMTGIIIKGLECGSFSLRDFYLSRAIRIIPALLVLCISLLIFGWIWLPNVDYKMLSAHVGTAVAFVSNIKLWREAGYFDAASHEKWLLHTWSLSVEWQFYILFPIVCLLLWRWFGKRGVKITLVTAGLLSLSLSIYASRHWPGAAFYLLPTRAWEMLAGGLVWWVTRTQPIPRQWVVFTELVGFSLIILSITTFDPEMQWPGYLALIPVMGTMLVLAANRQHSWLTANSFACRIGASSYSIYLWHWPLVVLLAYAGEQANPYWIALGILGSLVLGELSLRGVENPARKSFTKFCAWSQTALLAAVTGTVGLTALLMFVGIKLAYPSLIERINPAIELALSEKLNNPLRMNECLLGPGKGPVSPMCKFGNGELKAVVVGDSHANSIVSAVTTAANGSVIEMSFTSCPTVLGLKRKYDADNDCGKFNSNVIKLINGEFNNKKVIIVNRASYMLYGQNEEGKFKGIPLAYFDVEYNKPNDRLNRQFKDNLINTMCSIVDPSRVYLVRPIPEMGVDVPNTMARTIMFGKTAPQISISLEEYHTRHKVVWEAQDAAVAKCGVNILDPLPYLCHDGRCWGSKNARPLYRDDDHLSEYGNKSLIPMFKLAFPIQPLP
ncbi:acyltransferase family protein [Edwardsiella tarda]|uniref:acyltransferase family protein n=1 Tax=Edwardsiella tarda TaxID=636 RepID=UPI000D515044|nr:acyltransferase family protein [Edwardsiella tarda]UCQ11985.1 acyltransferase [Edwardsiella tarda]